MNSPRELISDALCALTQRTCETLFYRRDHWAATPFFYLRDGEAV